MAGPCADSARMRQCEIAHRVRHKLDDQSIAKEAFDEISSFCAHRRVSSAVAVLAPATCVAPAPTSFGWLNVTLTYDGPQPVDLYVRISLTAPQVTGGASGHFSPPLVYAGQIGSVPDIRIDLLLCGGCGNKMNFVYQPGRCLCAMTWWNGTRYASFDSANCYVMPVPAMSTPFVYNNNYYVASQQTTICQLGGYDGANC
jgi:hypothetical protein